METGISVYPGLGQSNKDILALMEKAADLGIRRLFTSLHIPETDTASFRQQLDLILASARNAHFDVIADVSPSTCQLLGLAQADVEKLSALGITTLRFDEGLDAAHLALYSQVVRVQINASTVQEKELQELQKNKADFSHIDGLHNFYPRPHTGLDEAYFTAQTKLLHAYGLSVGAFLPSQTGKRAPLYEGLPTLEAHRHADVSLAARHLSALGVQSIFLGDDRPSLKELTALARAGREETGVVVLKARLLSKEAYIQDLLSYTFTTRPDPSRDVIRTSGSRSHLRGRIIEPDSNLFRSLQRGDITLDNADFLRYMGEVQIVKRDLPPEERTNIVAKIVPNEEFLLAYLTPGRKFRFEFIR